MGDVAFGPGGVADFLDEILVGLEGLSSRLEALEAAGELTPEKGAEIASAAERLWLALASFRETVDPTGAPLLLIKRRVEAKARELAASGMTDEAIRSAFVELVDSKSWALPEDQRPLLGPLVDEALDAAMVERAGGQEARRSRPGMAPP